MLVSCPDCEHKISRRAESCPFCGYRVLPPARVERGIPVAPPLEPVTIQQTAKRWKKIQLWGAALTLIGLILGMIGLGLSSPLTGPPVVALLGLLTLSAGLVIFITARVCGWWYHG